MIRDRIVCGVNDSRIQRALLQEPKLTYEKALEITQGIEAASMDMQALNPTSNRTIQRITEQKAPKAKKGQPGACYRCGGKHFQQQCRFRNETCRGCGHIERVCRSKGDHRTKLQDKHPSNSTIQAPPLLVIPLQRAQPLMKIATICLQ